MAQFGGQPRLVRRETRLERQRIRRMIRAEYSMFQLQRLHQRQKFRDHSGFAEQSESLERLPEHGHEPQCGEQPRLHPIECFRRAGGVFTTELPPAETEQNHDRGAHAGRLCPPNRFDHLCDLFGFADPVEKRLHPGFEPEIERLKPQDFNAASSESSYCAIELPFA